MDPPKNKNLQEFQFALVRQKARNLARQKLWYYKRNRRSNGGGRSYATDTTNTFGTSCGLHGESKDGHEKLVQLQKVLPNSKTAEPATDYQPSQWSPRDIYPGEADEPVAEKVPLPFSTPQVHTLYSGLDRGRNVYLTHEAIFSQGGKKPPLRLC